MPGGGEERVARRVRRDVGVGVALEAPRLVRARTARRGASARPRRGGGRRCRCRCAGGSRGPSCRLVVRRPPVRRRRTEWPHEPLVAPALGARRHRHRRRGPGDELRRGDGAHHPRVARRGRRGAGHPAHPGALAEQAISLVGQLDKPLLVLGIVLFLLAMFALAGLHGAHVVAEAAAGVARPGHGRRGRGPAPAGRGRGRRPPRPRRPPHLGGAAARTHRAAADGGVAPRAGVTRAAGLPHGRRRARRRRRGRRGRRPRRRRRSPARRREPAAAAPRRGDAPRGAGRRLVGTGGGHPVADAQRRLLPDPHGHLGAGDRAQGLAPAHPRDGRPRARAHLRRPHRPGAHRVVGDPQLRVATRSAGT